MPKRRKYSKDVEYYVTGRKKVVAKSTKGVSDFLAITHEDNPTFTIRQLKALITDSSRYILDPEAVAVLDAHIDAGYGDQIPKWRY